jgi:hypothetical protein
MFLLHIFSVVHLEEPLHTTTRRYTPSDTPVTTAASTTTVAAEAALWITVNTVMIISDYKARAKAPFQTYKILVKYTERKLIFLQVRKGEKHEKSPFW